jgi:hypothetical protein
MAVASGPGHHRCRDILRGTPLAAARKTEGKNLIQLRPSPSEKPTVGGGRKPNGAFRPREYLTEAEIEALRKAARKNRNPVRDELLVVLAFRHALRVSELVPSRSTNSTSRPPRYTSGGPRTARQASTGCKETSCA